MFIPLSTYLGDVLGLVHVYGHHSVRMLGTCVWSPVCLSAVDMIICWEMYILLWSLETFCPSIALVDVNIRCLLFVLMSVIHFCFVSITEGNYNENKEKDVLCRIVVKKLPFINTIKKYHNVQCILDIRNVIFM